MTEHDMGWACRFYHAWQSYKFMQILAGYFKMKRPLWRCGLIGSAISNGILKKYGVWVDVDRLVSFRIDINSELF